MATSRCRFAHFAHSLAAAIAIITAAATIVTHASRADACVGTPPPPSVCGKTYTLAKAMPVLFIATSATPTVVNVPTFHFLKLTESVPANPSCPPPPYTVSGTYSIIGCVPPFPPTTGVPWGPFPISTGGTTITIPVTIPPGPVRVCVLTMTATVTFSDGSTVMTTGDQAICVVDPAPGNPNVPRLDFQFSNPGSEIVGVHAGDQASIPYILTNNDPVETWTGALFADFRNNAKQPSETPLGPIRTAYALADTGDGDDWPIEFEDNLTPGQCITLPPDPHNQILSEATRQPITLLPGESIVCNVLARPWGMCANGSCGESTVSAIGTFSDSTDGVACLGAVYYVDNSLPPQFLCDDSGSASLFEPFTSDRLAFGPGSLPFESVIEINAADAVIDSQSVLGALSIHNGADHGDWAGRLRLDMTPLPGQWTADDLFDIQYHVEFDDSPDPPLTVVQLTQIDLIPGAPPGFENEAPTAVGLLDLNGIDDAVHQFLHQISAVAELDNGDLAQIDIQNVTLTPTASGYDVQFQGSVPSGPPPGTPVDTLLVSNDFKSYLVPVPTCPGDFDGDGDTDVFDFATFAPAFGSTGNPPFTNGDLDGDGDVDIFDFAIFVTGYGCHLN